MKERDLLGTNLNIKSAPNKAFNLDTILLADFVNITKNTKLIYDFGSGNAAIMLYLSQKTSCKIIGIEIQEKRHELAVMNISINNLSNQLSSINKDIKAFKGIKKADIIVSNPPYFKINKQTKRSIDQDFLIAKHEVSLNLEDLAQSVRKNLNHGGLFCFIHQASRLDEIILVLNKYDFFVKRIRFVHPYLNSKPNQVLIEAKFKGSMFLNIMPPLIQFESKDILSSEMKSIYEGRSYYEKGK